MSSTTSASARSRCYIFWLRARATERLLTLSASASTRLPRMSATSSPRPAPPTAPRRQRTPCATACGQSRARVLALVGLYWDWLRASPVRRLFPALQVEYNGQRMMFDDSCANGSGSFSSRERAGVRGPRVWDKAPHPNPLPKGEGKEWAHSKGQGRDDLWKYSAHTTTPLAKRLSVLRGRRKCQGSDVRCRVTHVAGQATYQAALAVHQQICEVAAHVLGCPTTAVALDNSACVVHSAPTRRLTFAEVAAAA